MLLNGAGTFRDSRGFRAQLHHAVDARPLRQAPAGGRCLLQAARRRPAGYLLVQVHEPKNLDGRPSLSYRGPAGAPHASRRTWLQPNQCFIVSDVTFEQLTGGQAFKQFASTAQLIEGLRSNIDYGADVRVEVHSRVVKPLLDVTLLMLGLPLVVTRHNRNVFIAIGMGLGVVTVFSLLVITMIPRQRRSLSRPAQAAWTPLLVFVPIAVAMFEGICGCGNSIAKCKLRIANCKLEATDTGSLLLYSFCNLHWPICNRSIISSPQVGYAAA